MSADRDAPADPQETFKIWVSNQPHAPAQLGSSGAVVKPGPQVLKTVTRSSFGDQTTGVVSRHKLTFRTHSRKNDDGTWDFEADPKTTWWCENEEVDRLLAFLHSDVEDQGRYRVIDVRSPAASLLALLEEGGIDVDVLAEGLRQHGQVGELVRLLSHSGVGLSAAQESVIADRRRLVRRFRALLEEPATTETELQSLIGNAYWLFGGRYVGVAERRNLTTLDQHDIPLLGADGTLHIVELKGPNIPTLVHSHRNHWIVGKDIHEAVLQAVNYIRALDEDGAGLSTKYRNELGQEYDMRRVFATVVIGHPRHVRTGPTGPSHMQIQHAIRSYNAHLSRVQVTTYQDLVDEADRALAFEGNTQQITLPHERAIHD